MADYDGYFQMYNASNGNVSGQEYLDDSDIGFRLLVYIGNYFGLKFAFFKAVLYFIFGTLLINALVRISNISANIVLALYIFYPLILDFVQIRHFMAMSSFLFAFSFFINSVKTEKFKYGIFFYFIPSILFHASFSILIALLIIASFVREYIDKRQFFIKNLLLLVICFFTIQSLVFIFNKSSIDYFKTTTSVYTILFYTSIYFIFYSLLYYFGKKIDNHADYRAFNLVFVFTTLLIGTTLPLLFYNVEFFRYFRVLLLIILSIFFTNSIKSKRSFFLYFMIFAFYVAVAVIIYNASYIESVLLPILFLGEGLDI